MNARKRIALAAFAAAGLLAAAFAGAQAPGSPPPGPGPGPGPSLGGFSVENVLMELSLFMPEQYAGFRGSPGRPGGAGGPGGSGGPGAAAGAGQPGGRTSQQPNRFVIPEFKRDAKLMLTAAQIDALLPVLLDLQKNPFPTPSQAKKVAATVEATLTKQQKDAYQKYAKERDKAIEEMRTQFQSRTGTQGQGGVGTRGGPGAPTGQGSQGQRQPMDPAELRRRMLDVFVKNMQDYRAGLT